MNTDRKFKIGLIISTVLFGLCLVPSAILSLFTVMLFDAPGSEDSLSTWMLALSIISFPILIIISLSLGWINYSDQKYKKAFQLSLLPLFSIIFFAAALGLVQAMCDGNLVC